MNVSLTPELEAYVQAKVASGLYSSASEVLRDGLRLLQERDQVLEARLAGLKTEIDKGLRDSRAGRSKRFDDEAVDRIKAEGRKRLGATRGKKRA